LKLGGKTEGTDEERPDECQQRVGPPIEDNRVTETEFGDEALLVKGGVEILRVSNQTPAARNIERGYTAETPRLCLRSSRSASV